MLSNGHSVTRVLRLGSVLFSGVLWSQLVLFDDNGFFIQIIETSGTFIKVKNIFKVGE